WHVCTQWVVGNALGFLDPTSPLAAAASWFTGTDTDALGLAAGKLGTRCLHESMAALRSIAEPSALANLLPYILDPHGPGSRLSVMRNPATRAARARKRTHGVFYTPADVAEYMTDLALAHLAPCHPVIV